MNAPQKILVPTDFSDTSRLALDYAKTLAKGFGSSIDVLHVLEEPLLYNSQTAPSFRVEFEAKAKEHLDQFLPPAERDAFQSKASMTPGAPFVEIIRYARDKNIDLIVMGTHGRTALRHMFLGSVAEKVVRKAPCPVLTVRDPGFEFEHP